MDEKEKERRAKFENYRCRGTGMLEKQKIMCQGCMDCDWVAAKAYREPEWAKQWEDKSETDNSRQSK